MLFKMCSVSDKTTGIEFWCVLAYILLTIPTIHFQNMFLWSKVCSVPLPDYCLIPFHKSMHAVDSAWLKLTGFCWFSWDGSFIAINFSYDHFPVTETFFVCNDSLVMFTANSSLGTVQRSSGTIYLLCEVRQVPEDMVLFDDSLVLFNLD